MKSGANTLVTGLYWVNLVQNHKDYTILKINNRKNLKDADGKIYLIKINKIDFSVDMINIINKNVSLNNEKSLMIYKSKLYIFDDYNEILSTKNRYSR